MADYHNAFMVRTYTLSMQVEVFGFVIDGDIYFRLIDSSRDVDEILPYFRTPVAVIALTGHRKGSCLICNGIERILAGNRRDERLACYRSKIALGKRRLAD